MTLTHASLIVLVSLSMTVSAVCQSQVLDAQIDGRVLDVQGGIIAGARVTVVNVETGSRRIVASRDSGGFRLPLLPLGEYSVTVEHPNFQRFERGGITLTAGQTATVNVTLQPGSPNESVTITSDAPIADQSKFEIGRHINQRDVAALPLVSRNPFNFVLLQPGTSGRSVGNPVVVNLSSNGLVRRVGYEMDGAYSNETELYGFRLTPISDIYVKEVVLLSGGYSAEFGNTAGNVVNVITPSGTNDFRGTVTARYRPHFLSARPFDFEYPNFDPRTKGWGLAVTASGPFIKDRWHYYTGYEVDQRFTPQLLTTTSSDRAALISAGVPASVFEATANDDRLPYFIFRTDFEIAQHSRAAFRYTRFDNALKYSLGFASTTQATQERSTDVIGWGQTIAGQLVSSITPNVFNELRFQRAERTSGSVANSRTGSGPAITIAGVVGLGSPTNIGGREVDQSSMHFQDSTTIVLDRHTLKFGGGVNFIRDTKSATLFSQYNFNSVADFIRAYTGNDRRSYAQYIQTFGDPTSESEMLFLNLFFQDEWAGSRRLRISAGLRYDLYVPPKGSPNAVFEFSRRFPTDKNNFGPRLGATYLLRDGHFRTVIRGGAGLHFDPPALRPYRRATLDKGDPAGFITLRFLPFTPGAPAFPDTLGTLPAGSAIGRRDIDAVAPDMKTMSAMHANVQIEQAFGEDLSVTAGFLYSAARHIPVYRNINCTPTGRFLADGRPIYGSAGNPCSSRPYPQYGLIMMVEPAGNMTYTGAFLQLNKRYSHGIQIGASYTFSKARDNAPEDLQASNLAASDPSNRRHDQGSSNGDVRHVLRMTAVIRPRFSISSRIVSAFVNGYEVGAIVLADSGEVQNFVTSLDLNQDGVFGASGPDRPVGVPRNSLRIPPYFNIDLSLSRRFSIGERRSVQIRTDASNLLNGRFVSAYNPLVPASAINAATGEFRGPLPDIAAGRITWRPSRQMLLSLQVNF